MRKLTAKQHKFKDGLISGMGQSEAYRAAYDCKRMKAETINNKAYVLANRDDIRAMVEAARQKAEDAAIWNRKHALEVLQKIADADIKDFLEFKTAPRVVGENNKTGEQIIDYHHIVDLMDSADVDGQLIQEVSISKDGTLKFKLYDKLKAAEMANRMCGYNEPDKVQIFDSNADVTEMFRLAGYKKND